MNKECPLLAVACAICMTIDKTKSRGSSTQCKKRQCEWYDYDNECCNIQHLQNIAEIMRGQDR